MFTMLAAPLALGHATANASTPRVRVQAASVSSARVLHMRGTVSPWRSSWRVSAQRRIVSTAGRIRWSTLSPSARIRGGRFALAVVVPGASGDVVVRAVVRRGWRVVGRGPARRLVPASSIFTAPLTSPQPEPTGGGIPTPTPTPTATPAPRSSLAGGDALNPGDFLVSLNGTFKLIMQSDGNLVLYRGTQVLWSSGAKGAGAYAAMQTDGNLVIYSAGLAKWTSNTADFPGAKLQLQDDGKRSHRPG